MSRSLRIGSAVSAITLAAVLAGCAAPKAATSFASKPDENVGLATRALVALNSHDLPTAISLAERAVEKTPDDAGYRALLGNAYFAAGRFTSAEGAFKDSLTLFSNQPKVILKLALIEAALGKNDQAVAFLQAGQSVLEPSDMGLALALAGRPSDAVELLDSAARQPGADATVRQNLALAHALEGDWTQARTIAAQDVPADQVDARIHEWMQFATPAHQSDQVAALIGVKPVASDQGQPVRLALRKTDTLLAATVPAPKPAAPQPVEAAQPQLAYVAPPPPPVAPQVAEAPAPAPSPVAALVATARETAANYIPFFAKKPPVHVASVTKRLPPPRPFKAGGPVVQLGAYSSPEFVNVAWNQLTKKHPALRAYRPVRARFNSSRGTVWRLSVQGFSTQQEAALRCQLLKASGGNCFVRAFAGDAPVRMASI